MAAQFHPLSPQTDYSIASTNDDNDNCMDEISLASSSHLTSTTTTAKSKIISSGASVSSKFSRASRKISNNNIDNSDLGVPLTSSTSLDDDDNQDNYTDNETGTYIGAQTPNTQSKKSYISEDDPFYIFRTDLQQKLTLTSSTLSTYLNLVQTTDTATNTHEIKECKKQLKRYIKQCESTINDLTTTIKVVTNNRSKFSHITNKELVDRQNFVDKSSDTIVKIKLDMNSESVKEKIRNDELALRERRKGGSGSGDNVATAISSSRATPVGLPIGRNGYSKAQDLEEGNVSSERAETLLMMKQQDDTLTDLDMAVTRVGYIW